MKTLARAPDIAILHPRDGYTYQAGQSLRLWGTAVDAEGTPSSGERCTWTLDGKEVGNGFDVWIAAPKAGKPVRPGECRRALLLLSIQGAYGLEV